MKTKFFITSLMMLFIVFSCKKDDMKSISGDQSPMGEIGNTVSSSSAAIAGVSNFSASVVSLSNGVSSYSGKATVTNAAIQSILNNAPEFTKSGNSYTASGIKFKSTTEGIESVSGLDPGIIVKYDSNVGDSYTTASGVKRTVLSKSTTDDYYWGMMAIKAMQVEENTAKMGIKKITYWANHKWGLVGMEVTFDDGTTAKFPIYNSGNN